MPSAISLEKLVCLNSAFSIIPERSTKDIEELCKIKWNELLILCGEGLIVAISEEVPVINPDNDLWKAGPNLTNRIKKEQARISLNKDTPKNERRYIRLGAWCDCGKSLNSASREFEAGISAYRAIPESDKWKPLDECFWKKNHNTRKSLTPWYLIHGEEVGSGFDGEILLKDVQVEARLAWDESALAFAIEEILSTLKHRRHNGCQ